MADVAAKLWDSWEDGAAVRDAPTGRFLDRDKLHHVDFTGEAFSVRGPALAPRPPQGHPVRVVDATEGPARSTAARHADVALVRAASPRRPAPSATGCGPTRPQRGATRTPCSSW